VVVTGVAGFIGSHAAEAFKARGDEVLGIDNMNDYYNPAQKRQNVKEIAQKGITCNVCDVRSVEAYRLIVAFAPDVIVHLAAMAGVRYSLEKPTLYMDVNVVGTQNILDAAREVGAYVVAASSSSVYGDCKETPFNEEQEVNAQISPYAASKRAIELLANVHNHSTGLPISCLRFFTVYGPRGRPDMAPYKFMDAILKGKTIEQYGDGTTARDYTYVGDIVDGIVRCADRPDGFQLYNLGNSTPVSLREMIRTIEDACGVPANILLKPMQPGDVTITFADISKARTKLGYCPSTSFAEGIRKQHEWFTAREAV
jgi:UDP-glucuronate 4-epimerase